MNWIGRCLLAISIAGLLGCSGSSDEVSMGFLVLHSGSYDGRVVTVEGHVRGMEEPEHYWLEDSHYNRVGLRPKHQASSYLDQQVRLVGRFEASSEKGRRIRIQQVQALPEDH